MSRNDRPPVAVQRGVERLAVAGVLCPQERTGVTHAPRACVDKLGMSALLSTDGDERLYITN